MTPEEILAGLRDIQLPAVETAAFAESWFSPWPLVVVVVILSGIFLLRLRNRQSWRRSLRRDVEAFIARPETAGIHGLIDLRRRFAAHGFTVPNLPAACFGRAEMLDAADLRGAAEDLRRLLPS